MSSVYENRSIFNARPSYDNIVIMVTNEPYFGYSSDSCGFSYL